VMLEGILTQMLSDVYRRPRMMLHLAVAAIAVILFEYAGIRLPLSIASAMGLGGIAFRERGVLIAVDLFAALVALTVYLALVLALFSIIGRALSKALEHLDLSKPFDSIDKLRNSCFVGDIVSVGSGKRGWLSLMLLSLLSTAIILSYYSSIVFFLYALNDWLSVMGIPSPRLPTSSGRIVLLIVADLSLTSAVLALLTYMQWGSDTEGEGDRDMLSEWAEYLVRRYFFDNCIRKRGAVVLASLTPLVPKYRAPRLRYSTLVIPRSLAEARLEKLAGPRSAEAATKPRYSIENYGAFKRCIGKPLDMKKLKEGIFKNLCVARLYEEEKGRRKHLGILIAATTTVIVGQKLPLRMLKHFEAIVFVKPEEEQTYIALLSLDPSAAEFRMRLVTG